MSYEPEFLEEALAEWHRLDSSVKTQVKKKLIERLEEPRLQSAKLFGHADIYQIKLRSIGYRLVYEAEDGRLVVPVVARWCRDLLMGDHYQPHTGE